jgi:hypothetical protein
MECKNPAHEINELKCFNRWPRYPCYSERDNACYNINGDTQLFDPVSDIIYGVTSAGSKAYNALMEYFMEKPSEVDHRRDLEYHRLMHNWALAQQNQPITPLPESVGRVLPVGRMGERDHILYDNPIINVSEERRYDHIIPSVDDMLMEEGVPEQKEDDGIRAPILRRLPSNGENAAGKKKRRRKTKRRRKRRRRKTRNIKG